LTDLTGWADRIEARLGAGRRVEVYPATASTQDTAKRRAGESLLVVADHQTHGRGRLGRAWLAPPGTAALFSFTHHPADGGASVDRVSFLAAVGVARAIERLAPGLRIGIKWPNDLVVDGRKLAGILVEAVAGAAVIGVGINVSLDADAIAAPPQPLDTRTTSLAVLGHRVGRPALIAEAVAQTDACLAAADIAPLAAEWRDRSVLSHQTLALLHNGQRVTGSVVDLDPDAGLILRRDTGELVTLPSATTTVVTD